MKYPIAIEPGDESRAWGVVVPDLPGCYSAADDGIDEAIENAKEAITLWIETALDDGMDIPSPSSITVLRRREEFDGWIWAVVEIDSAVFDDTIERVNVSLPRRILARLDAKARAAGTSRSGLIAQIAVQPLSITHVRS